MQTPEISRRYIAESKVSLSKGIVMRHVAAQQGAVITRPEEPKDSRGKPIILQTHEVVLDITPRPDDPFRKMFWLETTRIIGRFSIGDEKTIQEEGLGELYKEWQEQEELVKKLQKS